MFETEYTKSAIILDECWGYLLYECDYDTNILSIHIYNEDDCIGLNYTLTYQTGECIDGLYFDSIQCYQEEINTITDNSNIVKPFFLWIIVFVSFYFV